MEDPGLTRNQYLNQIRHKSRFIDLDEDADEDEINRAIEIEGLVGALVIRKKFQPRQMWTIQYLFKTLLKAILKSFVLLLKEDL